jgi:hypothetical protein
MFIAAQLVANHHAETELGFRSSTSMAVISSSSMGMQAHERGSRFSGADTAISSMTAQRQQQECS